MGTQAHSTDVDLCVVGAPLDTGNLGVSALGLSTLAAVARRRGDTKVTLFDNGSTVREGTWSFPGGQLHVTQRGMWLSRRLHRPESLWQMRLTSVLPRPVNANVRDMAQARAVWDLSGGDSFSDIYGSKRYAQVTNPKRVALRAGRRLVLLPQTYGPFRSPTSRTLARAIVLGASEVWARDVESHERLRDLLGDEFDPDRHRLGVDVAFTLPAMEPAEEVLGDIRGWLADPEPVVGVNVSGLLTTQHAREQFGLAANHEDVLAELVGRLLDSGCRVVLVPHVLGVIGEVDNVACRRLAARLDVGPRLAVLSDDLDAVTAKWIIGRLDWMTGARMHATIAALSSFTPVTGIAYSDKMHGVFESCGVRDQVADARRLDRTDLVDALWEGFQKRDDVRDRLGEHVPTTVRRAEATFDHLVGSLWS